MVRAEQETIRRAAREALIEKNIAPYPSVCLSISHQVQHIHERFVQGSKDFQSVCLAGRMMSRRIMGAAAFVELQDSTGRIQIYIRRDEVCPPGDHSLYNDVFKKKMDIGDIFQVEGTIFITQRGETTLHAKYLRLLAKALRPLPIVKEHEVAGEKKLHDAFVNPESRYRQRYVDLIVNPTTQEIFRKRARMMDLLREQLSQYDYVEVETPILQPIHGGAAAKPFVTHHHALGMPLFMRVANELYLKRLIVGGFSGVYEFAKDFRNEGMSRFHNPEFTQLELYVAYKDYRWMATFVEALLTAVTKHLHGSYKVQHGNRTIDFTRPWKQICFYDALREKTDKDLQDADIGVLRMVAKAHNVPLSENETEAKLLDNLFGMLCEKTFLNPTIVIDYPLCLSPLAKKHPTKKNIVERFEVICNSKELCNAYSELNDPVDQRLRFEAQCTQRATGDEEAMEMDEDFLRALEYGMPPTAGLGIGIDRLAMVMCDATSIQEVILFPQMRPETFSHTANESSTKK